MKYGKVVAEQAALVPELAHFFVPYKSMKGLVHATVLAEPSAREAAADEFWDAVAAAQQLVERFTKRALAGLEERLEGATTLVKQQEAQRDGHDRELYQRSKEEVEDVELDVAFMKAYTEINFTALRKMIKKFVKHTTPLGLRDLEASAAAATNAAEKSPANAAAAQRWSELESRAAALRLRVKTIKAAILQEDTLNQVFQRKTRKFFVRVSDLPRVKQVLQQHLSLFVFDGSTPNARTTSIYFDTPNMEMYHRRFMRYDGATLVRFRWYVAWGKSKVFIEKKTHREGDVPSLKERTGMAGKRVNKMLASRSLDVDTEDALANEIMPMVVRKNGLKPKIRVAYNRVAYQVAPDDPSVRVSIDTNLEMSAVLPNRQQLQFMKSGADTYYFPCAVLEVKLTGSCPPWLEELQTSSLLVEAYRFSKYCHGVLMMNQDRLEYLNLDVPDYLRRKLGTPLEELVVPPVYNYARARAVSTSRQRRAPGKPALGGLRGWLQRKPRSRAGSGAEQGKGKGKAALELDAPQQQQQHKTPMLSELYRVDLEDGPGTGTPAERRSRRSSDVLSLPDDVLEELREAEKQAQRRSNRVSRRLLGKQPGSFLDVDVDALSPKARKMLRRRIKNRNFNTPEYTALTWLDMALPEKSGTLTNESKKWRKAKAKDRALQPFILDQMYKLPPDGKPGIKLPRVLYRSGAVSAAAIATGTAEDPEAGVSPGSQASTTVRSDNGIVVEDVPGGRLVNGTEVRSPSQRLLARHGSRARKGSSGRGDAKRRSSSGRRRSTSSRNSGTGRRRSSGSRRRAGIIPSVSGATGVALPTSRPLSQTSS